MKKLIYLVVLLMLLGACQRQGQTDKTHVREKAQQAVEQRSDSPATDIHDTMPKYNNEPYTHAVSDYDYTAPYICPNHCPGSGSDKPGKCPVCGMDLIPNPDYQKDK